VFKRPAIPGFLDLISPRKESDVVKAKKKKTKVKPVHKPLDKTVQKSKKKKKK
jgi:hypothetical protein